MIQGAFGRDGPEMVALVERNRLDKTSGRLTEIGRNPIPYNSPQGLAGF